MSQVQRMLADPGWFPQALDLASGVLSLVPTDRQQLSEQPFMDGRSDFSTGEARRIGLADAVALDRPWAADEPERMIFHVGFCGSTLLATLLHWPGKSFVLREPNVLVDLANAQHSGRPVDPALALALDLLRRPWMAGERVACKPSNWVNNLLPKLTADPRTMRPLFITAEPREFLLAAFRGGRDRLAFLITLAAHLAPGVRGGEELWRAGSMNTADPLDRAARLVFVALEMQLRLFEDAQARGGWGEEHRLQFRDIKADLLGSATKAGQALDLPLTRDELNESVAHHRHRHAKQRGLDYSARQRGEEDAEVERHHGRRIEAALEWGNWTFGKA